MLRKVEIVSKKAPVDQPETKLPDSLLADPFKDSPPVNVEAEFLKAETKLYEMMQNYSAVRFSFA